MRVRICDSYTNWYFNSGNGITLTKENREGVECNDNNPAIILGLQHGILELVKDEDLKQIKNEIEAKKIVTDSVPKDTIKEVVTNKSKV